jgi:hypothetical protein
MTDYLPRIHLPVDQLHDYPAILVHQVQLNQRQTLRPGAHADMPWVHTWVFGGGKSATKN